MVGFDASSIRFPGDGHSPVNNGCSSVGGSTRNIGSSTASGGYTEGVGFCFNYGGHGGCDSCDVGDAGDSDSSFLTSQSNSAASRGGQYNHKSPARPPVSSFGDVAGFGARDCGMPVSRVRSAPLLMRDLGPPRPSESAQEGRDPVAAPAGHFARPPPPPPQPPPAWSLAAQKDGEAVPTASGSTEPLGVQTSSLPIAGKLHSAGKLPPLSKRMGRPASVGAPLSGRSSAGGGGGSLPALETELEDIDGGSAVPTCLRPTPPLTQASGLPLQSPALPILPPPIPPPVPPARQPALDGPADRSDVGKRCNGSDSSEALPSPATAAAISAWHQQLLNDAVEAVCRSSPPRQPKQNDDTLADGLDLACVALGREIACLNDHLCWAGSMLLAEQAATDTLPAMPQPVSRLGGAMC
eukprot:TRINITY_DN57018_c0_g1_i1.p1 TRINITY_DN57018_c0_g1~~TRINITY_DN57018_c0_g1_i1.p1  ORF type:complete len:443 (-),score=81.75 TRINITY_DN57018_c0_g1_i1:79-1311(-)